jgi:hypothetical protein
MSALVNAAKALHGGDLAAARGAIPGSEIAALLH